MVTTNADGRYVIERERSGEPDFDMEPLLLPLLGRLRSLGLPGSPNLMCERREPMGANNLWMTDLFRTVFPFVP